MGSLTEKLLKRSGLTEVPKYSTKGCVSYTSEFRRIESLPRRNWETSLDFEFIAKCIYHELRLSGSKATLWPVQLAAIYEATMYGGAFLSIGVGQGKAFISLLVSSAMEAKRPLLIVPAQLRDQTRKNVIPRMKELGFKLHPNQSIVGYEELGLAKNANFFDDLKPDLIVFDECQYLKDPKSARTKRTNRYYREHPYPQTKGVAMSGTPAKESIMNFAHIAYWCLRERTPIPLQWSEIMNWSDALDIAIPEEERISPGALKRFCGSGENVRQGFQRRLMETPGVIGTKQGDLRASLRIISRKIKMPKDLKKIMDYTMAYWEAPNGDIIGSGAELRMILRRLAVGFYGVWDPPAPDDWRDARTNWKSYVRETLRFNKRNLDTELQVENECEIRFPDKEEWAEWKRLKNTFTPNVVPVWLDDFALKICDRWMKSQTSKNPGIVWTESIPFGKRLSELTGIRYYGAGDSSISDSKETVIIASIGAHGTGKNLQHFSRNLITSPPSSGDTWEQLMGRTHRPYQKADTVICELFLYCSEYRKAFEKALKRAPYYEDQYGNKQRLLYADYALDLEEAL